MTWSVIARSSRTTSPSPIARSPNRLAVLATQLPKVVADNSVRSSEDSHSR